MWSGGFGNADYSEEKRMMVVAMFIFFSFCEKIVIFDL
jgi:hypothetical protein